jgi:hypothetical protein
MRQAHIDITGLHSKNEIKVRYECECGSGETSITLDTLACDHVYKQRCKCGKTYAAQNRPEGVAVYEASSG